MRLYCFDVDGTLDSSNGPVPVAFLRALIEAGEHVVIVSPSDARPKDLEWIAPAVEPDRRVENLRAARTKYPDCDRYVYVSDNNDMDQASAAGFEYVDRMAFP